MDVFDELENLAISAAYEEPAEDEHSSTHDPNYATINMWQDRFGYTYDEAAALIDITKSATKTSAQQAMLTPSQARTIYLLKLDGPLSTPAKVQIAANLPLIPESHIGSSDDGTSTFCMVDGHAKVAIETWLSAQNKGFRPLFVPYGRAYKELSSSSLYPTLGIDTTLPQFRPQDPQLFDHVPCFGQAQDQFPVWYFFYGTLASESKLCSLLDLPEHNVPVLYEANVTGGKMETWGNGKYNALVNGEESIRVHGWAYQVMSEEHEDALRKYETEAYEVVKCEIEMDGKTVQGRTFRFVGAID
ncbi:hypothetical protein VTL71DRAFT_4952 [Oculimacula yallundae]|uniref:Putative gamma-glutamylcyclotransferase n=1 Tax=Oculimacula yallundae TaxID=86028 RepID=A0ABR4C3J5_9HELO